MSLRIPYLPNSFPLNNYFTKKQNMNNNVLSRMFYNGIKDRVMSRKRSSSKRRGRKRIIKRTTRVRKRKTKPKRKTNKKKTRKNTIKTRRVNKGNRQKRKTLL